MGDWIIKYWIEFAFGIVTTILGVVVKKLAKKINEQESIKLGVQALLRDRIIQTYNLYHEKGFCPIYARENIQELAKQYTNLGGNGVVKDLLEKIKDLPTSLEGDED